MALALVKFNLQHSKIQFASSVAVNSQANLMTRLQAGIRCIQITELSNLHRET